MAYCYKCGIREAEVDGLCSECAKGAGRELRGITFETWKKKNANENIFLQFVRADEILMIYSYYKETKKVDPILNSDFGYRYEHDRLSKYVSEEIFKIIGETFQKPNNSYDGAKKTFGNIETQLNILSLMQRLKLNPDELDIFLKKIIRELKPPPKNITYSNIISPSVVDDIGKVTMRGSLLYLLNLFATIGDERFLEEFIKKLEDKDKKINKEYAERLIIAPLLLLPPWQHQNEAFEKWKNNNYRGIIEMATATGKTLIGLMAIEHLYKTRKEQEKKVVRILAHSNAILAQWRSEIIEKLGILRNTIPSTDMICIDNFEINFNTYQLVHRQPYNYPTDLLIADEVHHGAASEFRNALSIGNWKMGLSATVDGKEKMEILEDVLGPKVFTFSLREAQDKNILPKFKWVVHPVFLSIDELEEFIELSRKLLELLGIISRDYKKKIKELFGEDVGNNQITVTEVIKYMEKARYRNMLDKLPEEWKIFQGLILKRRWIVHRSIPKLDNAIELAKKYIEVGKKVMIFTMDISSCDLIRERLKKENVSENNLFIVHSEVKGDIPKILKRFKEAKYGVLIGARMLDEGIDIPDVEIGINVSSSKTRLQLVQRIGRILRKNKPEKEPVFHHFVGVIPDEGYVNDFDDIETLDDLSWVQDTALKMGLTLQYDREYAIEKCIQKYMDAESRISKAFAESKTIDGLYFGTFKLESFLKQIEDVIKKKIINRLDKIPENSRISDAEWDDILRYAFQQDYVYLPGNRWFLILCNREPKKIKEILTIAL